MRGKYVVTSAGPIVFPESIQHQCFEWLNPASAGFFDIEGKSIKVFGRSDSLNLVSKKEDAVLIEIFFQMRK